MKQQMQHAEYQKSLRNRSYSELHFIISDARQAIAAMPYSENVDYYEDEIHYAAMELNNRKKGI